MRGLFGLRKKGERTGRTQNERTGSLLKLRENRKNSRPLAFEGLEDRVLLAVQSVASELLSPPLEEPLTALLAGPLAASTGNTIEISASSTDTAAASQPYTLEISLNADPAEQVSQSLSILSLQIYFDSTFFEKTTPAYYSGSPESGVKINLSGTIATSYVPYLILSDLYEADLDPNFVPTLFQDTTNSDGDANTDYYLRIVWNSGLTQKWSLTEFPQSLAKLQFTIGEGIENRSTTVNFGKNDLTPGWTFVAEPATISVIGRDPLPTPDKPTAALTRNSWSEVCVSWDKTEGAGGYTLQIFDAIGYTTDRPPIRTISISADYVNDHINIDPGDPNYPSEDMSYTVTGLDDNTTYYFQLMARGAGTHADSGWSAVTQIETDSDAPTDISLTLAGKVYSGDKAETLIGTLSTTDINPDDTFEYALTNYGEYFYIGGEKGDEIHLKSEKVSVGTYKLSVISTEKKNSSHSVTKYLSVTILSGKPTATSGTKKTEASVVTPAGTVLAEFTTTGSPNPRFTQDDFTYTITEGNESGFFEFVGRELRVSNGVSVPLTAGLYTLTVRAATPSGEGIETEYQLTVSNVPVADISQTEVSVVAGCSFFLSAALSTPSDPAVPIRSYCWDLDGDGEAEIVSASPDLYLDSSQCRSERDDEGDRTVALWVVDSKGIVSAPVEVHVEITPCDPIISSRAVSFASGQVLKLKLQAYTSLPNTTASWEIFWGDGESQVIAAGDTLTVAHCYQAESAERHYSLAVRLTDTAEHSAAFSLGVHTVSAAAVQTMRSPLAEIFAEESPLASPLEEIETPVSAAESDTVPADALLLYLDSRETDDLLETIRLTQERRRISTPKVTADTEPLPMTAAAETASRPALKTDLLHRR